MIVGRLVFLFFQAEDGIRDLVRSRGLGEVYKRQVYSSVGGEATSMTPSPFRSTRIREPVSGSMMATEVRGFQPGGRV